MEAKTKTPNEIVDNKLTFKKKLNYFRNTLMADMYASLIENISPKAFSEKVFAMPNQVGIPDKYQKLLLFGVANLYRQLAKQNYYIDENGVMFAPKNKALSDGVLMLGVGALSQLEQKRIANDRLLSIANNVFNRLEYDGTSATIDKIIHEGLNDYEVEQKTNYINELKQSAKQYERVFYLCSWHADSATDHAPYQGKYYIAKNWRSIIQDKEIKEKIENFINIHKVGVFEEIIDKPVWLTTRPHCRHYFRLIDTTTVLSGKALEIVLQNYKMKREVGEKGERLQTIAHTTAGYWYREENVREIIERYYERLDLHEKMYKEYKSPYLYAAIRKDKLLVAKWKAYLDDNF